MTAPVYSFGPFRLDPAGQVLLRDGKPVDITPKDFGVLVVLVRNAGQIVTKEMLLAEVWPGSVVEEGNLARHIFNLRQLLGESGSATPYIETIPKRGYRFQAPEPEPAPVPQPQPALEPPVAPANEPLVDAPRKHATRWIVGGVVAALGLAIAGFLFLANRSADFEPGTRALVADFENQTGDARLNRALHTALVVSLEQSHHVAIVSREQINASLERMKRPADTAVDEAVGREICLREGFPLLISPSITKTGSTFALTARLVEARSGNVLRSYIERANGDTEILNALERIATQVRGGVGESGAAIAAANLPLEKVTTANLQALQLYSDGNRKWGVGAHMEGVALFEAAVALDDEFAMAHEMLGIANYSFVLNRPQIGKLHYERALALAGRTTLRERRKIEANYARFAGSFNKAVAAYEDYLRLWPDDRSIRRNLANMFRAAGDCAHALPLYEALRAEDDADGGVYLNMGACQATMGDIAGALLNYERGLELHPDNLGTSNVRHEYAMLHAELGQFDRARQILTVKLDDDETGQARAFRGLAMLDLYEGRFASAEGSFRKSLALHLGSAGAANPRWPLSSARDRLFLANALLGRGARAEAIRELRQSAVELDQHGQVYAEFRVGLGQSMVRAGVTADAELQLQQARQAIDASTVRGSSYIARLAAELALANARAAEAVVIIDASAESKGMDPVVQELLARALAAAGQVDRAIETYEKLVDSKAIKLGWEGQLAYPEAHLALARLYRSRGANDKALQAIEKLLRLWSNADPDAVLLREAQKMKKELAASGANAASS
jgi:DNA-binding winged helix-turn-helix (wHTH) protein/tetratricopeptide (TPR) repeat protein